MSTGINSISNKNQIYGNNNDLSKNFISSSRLILRKCNIRIKKNILIFLLKISSFLNLFMIFLFFYKYNGCEFNLEKKILQGKSKLRTERTLSQHISFKNIGDVHRYYEKSRQALIGKISQVKLRTNDKTKDVWDYFSAMNEKMLLKLDSIIIEFRNIQNPYSNSQNETWLSEWKQKIDERVKNVEEEWIGYINKTDISNMTASYFPNQHSSMKNTALAIILPFFILILGMILLYFVFERTSIGTRLGFRKSKKKGMRQNKEEI